MARQPTYPPSQTGYPEYPPPVGFASTGTPVYPSGQQYPNYGAAPQPQGQQPLQPGGYSQQTPANLDNIPQYQGPMPDDDLDENENANADVQPSAPPIEKIAPVPGYEHLHSKDAGLVLPPPSYDEVMKEPETRPGFENVPKFSGEEVREALLDFIAQHCCYGKGAAEQMRIGDIVQTSAFHYTLETFGENRTTKYEQTPYRGEPVDGPENGTPPGPWDIVPPSYPPKYENRVMKIDIPHTSTVIPCHQCFQMGFVMCIRCHGRGRVRCGHCHGRGHRTVFRDGKHEQRNCPFCVGGRKRCLTCHGRGMVICPSCEGQRQLRNFVQLTISWTNHQSDHVLEKTDLPDELIKKVTGQTVFEEDAAKVFPIRSFPEQVINEASERLIKNHSLVYQNERIHAQRQTIRLVPVAEVSCHWKRDKQFRYFVYGFEKSIYAPEYPQQCCCGCAIL